MKIYEQNGKTVIDGEDMYIDDWIHVQTNNTLITRFNFTGRSCVISEITLEVDITNCSYNNEKLKP
jgi:hypothetical protein